MSVREKFDIDLKELQGKLLEIGNFAQEALTKSIIALESQDLEMALEIIDNDANANLMYEDINDFAILLIAKQQPVAIDLRRIIVAIKIATNIERIADFAVNIAKSTIRIGSEPLVKPIVHIKEMHSITLEMLRLSLEAFNDEDIVKAKRLAEMDDKVDDLYGQTIRDLMQINMQKPEFLPQILQLSFICRYLERSADHITNIAESILYLVKGRQYDLN
ncbi:phosphate signaling complex protein PhoU [Bacillus sp. DTU_2020_1000418_1_SI_GHA_SEK_038]|uniref:phosphate signaling complex protein PhoU n=1 Tax=Bacillus sp. DTU_2020_1000418_1_SI_GHA_SEK_038 TaxID=3077585 RepID=UPI0028E27B21|nr:phosphate signaling complex protein PhoU [Bacillus sp. DTU_2020_1000418_1_SI_GHA_SEK_038]WNS74303.1 phosphate signaling complex protein PhoU [Bacillus sp. DTU_2020_1000418_1_SI_GHA_SEK_038]